MRALCLDEPGGYLAFTFALIGGGSRAAKGAAAGKTAGKLAIARAFICE
jgi:hypothetical protein